MKTAEQRRAIHKRWIMRARERGYLWADEAEELLRSLGLVNA